MTSFEQFVNPLCKALAGLGERLLPGRPATKLVLTCIDTAGLQNISVQKKYDAVQQRFVASAHLVCFRAYLALGERNIGFD